MGEKSIFLVDEMNDDFHRVYTDAVMSRLARSCGQSELPVIEWKNHQAGLQELSHATYVFSTWNMPVLTKDEVAATFPSLQRVFYAAGTVKYFSKPFMEQGVRIHSAASVNAIPVAEYAVAQIILATKGHFATRVSPMRIFPSMRKIAAKFPGNYKATVGILGAGNVGKRVIAGLRASVAPKILVYDPFVSAEECAMMECEKATIEEIFSKADVISNHMPDIPDTVGTINSELLGLMKPTAGIINTGRGRQVVEKDLVRFLRKNKMNYAVLDVTYPEPIRPWNALLRCPNAYITPHIAGSMGGEMERLGMSMAEEYERVSRGEPALLEIGPTLSDVRA